MGFLRFLENLRTPVGDAFFSLITRFGEESLFIIIGLVFLWCINKKQGYYLFTVGVFGLIINQFLKIWFRIPRPWVKDPNFTIVESAREAATGYSFPSGHTQTAVGAYGGIARLYKKPIIRISCIVLAVLVGLSRMYLGVHTPLDVIVSTIVAGVLIFVFYPIFERFFENPKVMDIIFAIITLTGIGYVLFVSLYNFPSDVDADNLLHGVENSYKILGSVLGIWLAYRLDKKFINFDTKAPFWVQLVKVAIGTVIVILIKSLLKQPLLTICGGHEIAGLIRYFIMVFFAACVWPLTFKFLPKK